MAIGITKSGHLVVQMGSGDVALGSGVNSSGNPFLEFRQLTAEYDIGTDALDLAVDKDVPHVFVSFANRKSFEILEQAVAYLRQNITNKDAFNEPDNQRPD